MLIKEYDELKVLQFLTYQRWANGNEFVVYLDDGFPTEIQEMICFSTESEADDFCKSESTDQDIYRSIGIRSAYRVLAEGNSAEAPALFRNGAIDLHAMINRKHMRSNQQELLTNKGENIMEKNEEILAFLQERLMFTGFGDFVDVEKLRKAINSGKEEIQLKVSAVYADGIMNAVLHFKKSDKSEKYFFNSYDAELKKIGVKEPIKQTFFINNNGGTITFKEAYNLMQGRAVNKNLTKQGTDEKYNAWLELDFSRVTEKGNFELKRHFNLEVKDLLAKYPIKELKNPQSLETLVRGLQKGNIQTVTFEKGKTEYTRLAVLNAQFRKFDFRSPDTGRITIESQIKVAQAQVAQPGNVETKVDSENKMDDPSKVASKDIDKTTSSKQQPDSMGSTKPDPVKSADSTEQSPLNQSNAKEAVAQEKSTDNMVQQDKPKSGSASESKSADSPGTTVENVEKSAKETEVAQPDLKKSNQQQTGMETTSGQHSRQKDAKQVANQNPSAGKKRAGKRRLSA